MTWTQALVAFGVALLPAMISGYFAVRARRSEYEMSRVRDLENRLAERKYEMYVPMLTVFSNVLTPGRSDAAATEMESALPDFMMSVGMFGSDDAIDAFYRFRVAAQTDPPSEITMRLVADFLVAARQDLSGSSTKISGLQIMGMRINDLLKHDNWRELFEDDFEEVCQQYGWTPPWHTA